MSQEQTISREGDPGAGPPAAPAGLPDLNSGKNPFELVQRLVDRAAWFNLYAIPDSGKEAAIRAPGSEGGVIGIETSAALRRFDVDLNVPSQQAGVKSGNVIGEAGGTLKLRWMMIPFDFFALPEREPPPTVLDPTRGQRFSMQEAGFSFNDGKDGFRGFGTGRTFPVKVGGRPQLLAAGVGSVLGGFGKFKGLEGNFILTGNLTADQGFVGNIVIRIVDPDETLHSADPVPQVRPAEIADPDPGATYLMYRSQKKGPEQKSSFGMSPSGQIRGVAVPLELRRVCIGYTSEGTLGLRSAIDFGAYVGHVHTSTATNPLAPGPGSGTPLSPFQFQGVSGHRFYDESGRTVGGFVNQVIVGRTFLVQLKGAPGQPALRFGFFGEIVDGSGYGCFEGVQGMMSGIAGVGIAPHVFSNLHLVRLIDPHGRYRALDGTGCQK